MTAPADQREAGRDPGSGGAWDSLPQQSFRKNASVRTLETDDAIVLLNPATRKVCLLNMTAAAIWDLLDDLHQVNAIVRTVQTAVPGHANAIRTDTLATVGELFKDGMIEVC